MSFSAKNAGRSIGGNVSSEREPTIQISRPGTGASIATYPIPLSSMSLNPNHQSNAINQSRYHPPPLPQPRKINPNMNVKQSQMQSAAMIESQTMDEEERAILQPFQDRHNNRRLRHANRRSVNTRVRVETNATLTADGLLGKSPQARGNSVIAWDTSVKTPAKDNIARGVNMPPTPVIRPIIYKQDFQEKSSIVPDIVQRVENHVKLLNRISMDVPERAAFVNRLATDFSALFLHLHADELRSGQRVGSLKYEVEIDAIRILNSECDREDIQFFIKGLKHSIKDFEYIFHGYKSPELVPMMKCTTSNQMANFAKYVSAASAAFD